MDELDFSGFMPAILNMEIAPSTSMITTEGNLIESHVIKLSLGNNQEIFFSATEKDLQNIFFLILKALNK